MGYYWLSKIKSLLDTNPGQMSEAEYMKVLETILKRAPCKILVFGMGKDSDLWNEANRGGLTVFLEHDPEWLRCLQNAVTLHVAYRTSLKDKWNLKPIENMPKWIDDIKWDIILVDAPEGYAPDLPGRLSSIKKASALISMNGVVFVHDMHRENEKDFTKKFLGPPSQIIGMLGIWKKDRTANLIHSLRTTFRRLIGSGN